MEEYSPLLYSITFISPACKDQGHEASTLRSNETKAAEGQRERMEIGGDLFNVHIFQCPFHVTLESEVPFAHGPKMLSNLGCSFSSW